jgi:Glycosyl hydrolases family 2, sugar binding domain/Glycosyl hydrolases family 2, TIM barrel domain/Glycosyl hydrolases family 2
MRAAQSLDGVWQARLDPADVGVDQGWSGIAAADEFVRTLTVPLAWQAADPELRTYSGVVWYRRTFQVPEGWQGQRVVARFGAVDYDARVWLNGRSVGGHTGGYTPFELDLTADLDWTGTNHLVLRVFDPPVMDDIPHGKQGGRWYTPVSGPWQSVTLLTRPAQRVSRLRCQPDASTGTFLIRADVCLDGSTSGRVDVVAFDPETRGPAASATAAVTADTPTALVELRIPAPKLWSPDHPHLYTVQASLRVGDGPDAGVDTLDERVGLRTFEARDGRLYLNGKPFYMRGALDQAYWPDTLYTPPSDAAIEREIRLAKDMGLNLLRKHIKPEDPRYLDACDRLGMLIWAEPANPDAFTPGARAALRRDLLEMIERDFNRPSVVIWSLYNEDWGLPGLWSDGDQHTWLKQLYAEVKALDPTRPVCDNSGWAHVLTDLNDYHEYFSVPDRIAAFKQRLDLIESQPVDNYAQGNSPRGGEPLLISEWGNWALPDPARARERNGGRDPHWFGEANSQLLDDMKTVAGFEERFERLGLADQFGTPAGLVDHVQRRAFRSLKAQIEEMRRRPAIQGWVVTELTDIEWEANGWLDYWREPKAFTPRLADLNADLALIATPERACVWGGDPVEVPVYVSDLTAHSVDGALRWWVEGTAVRGNVPATGGSPDVPAATYPIRFTAPDDGPSNARLMVELVQADRVLARTCAELAWAPRSAALVRNVEANAHTLDKTFRQRLERQGYRMPRSFRTDTSLSFTSRLTEQMVDYARAGGRVVWLAEEAPDGWLPDAFNLPIRGLPPGESWRMAGGVGWARADRLAPAPVLPDLGWEVANIFPRQGFDAAYLHAEDEQLAGWFEGWLANPLAFIVRRRVGEGQVIATTFRFAEAYGLDPTATLLLNRLVDIVRAG